jgi:glycerol uptake facilitator
MPEYYWSDRPFRTDRLTTTWPRHNVPPHVSSSTIMINYTAELFGTALLILFGDGVVANVLLSRSKGEGSGWIVITFGWGIAVMVAVYAVGRLSGAHLNPAVTLALASIGAFPWADVPGYVAAQMIGAMVGAGLVWLMYLPHWRVTDDANLKLAVFCTAPAVRQPRANLLTETIATAAFVFAVLSIAANAQTLAKPGDIDLSVVFSNGLQPLLIGGLVLGVGLSHGGPTGYAINPARDLGPRLAHFLLPIPGKRDSDWGYAWIPVVGPLLGGVIGAHIFKTTGF